MKIATHNINGIPGRLEMPLVWLAETRPDIVCLQELKAPQAQSPERELARAGYEAVCHSQSRWKGVAIPVAPRRAAAADEARPAQDPYPSQSRYIEAAVNSLLVP